MFTRLMTGAALVAALAGCSAGRGGPEPAAFQDHWRDLEKGLLANQVQLTFPDRYLKAGEAYLSPDGRRVIFQAVEVDDPAAEGTRYQMYVADLAFDREGRVTGLRNTRHLAPRGSFNTCGWFHPVDPDVVFFATTVDVPTMDAPGYQRASSKYEWRFPPECNIYRCQLSEADGTAGPLEALIVDDGAYLAECSVTTDGRHLLYCAHDSENGGDIYVKDLARGRVASLVTAPGYDGGPFFSPDNRRICYRSDRRGNDMLQLFVGELAHNEEGSIVGLKREYQLTDNGHVNFAPFWHPGGRYLAYTTSEEGHHNYEVFVLDADPGDLPGSTGTIKYGTGKRRLTHAPGFDGFPAFNADGTRMIWTSQRGEGGSSQVWIADLVMDVE